jgi:hypothetical protein
MSLETKVYSYDQRSLCEGLGLQIPCELGNTFCHLTIRSPIELGRDRIQAIARAALSHAMWGSIGSEVHQAMTRDGISYTSLAASYGTGKNMRFPS